MTTNNSLNSSLSGTTGTMNFVGSNSPTITTPVISQIKDNNGNVILNNISNANAIDFIQFTNAQAGSNPTIAAVGGNTNIALNLMNSGTSGVQYQGRSTNTNPPSGYVGEFMNSTIAAGSAVSLTTNTVVNITSLNLTAGDWDVWGSVAYIADTTTNITSLRGGSSIVSATLPVVISTSTGLFIQNFSSLVAGAVTFSFPFQMGRFSISTTTTVYLVCRANFTVSTLSTYGFLSARRSD